MGAGGVLALGFLLGLRHATDADHVAAVAALAGRGRVRAWLLGAAWGLGHTTTIVLAGLALIAFKLSIPPVLERGLESAVGLMLVGLGLANLAGRGLSGVTAHSHVHGHDDAHAHEAPGAAEADHEHPHLHLPPAKGLETPALWRSALVGMVHGLAGGAAAALLALAAIPDPSWAAAYLLVFGAGTIGGMLACTWLLETAALRLARHWGLGQRSIAAVTGLLSVLVGALVLWENLA